MIGKHLVVIALALLLAGCATAAQRQYQAMATGNQAIAAEGKACLEAAYNSPEFAPVRPHEAYNVTDATLPQLADTSLASQSEIDAIFAVHPRIRACQKAALDGMLNTTPSMIPIIAKSFSEADDDVLLLIQRKMSWGEFTRRRRDRFIATQAAIQTEDQRITAGLERQHEGELARRQAAADAIAQWAQTQQIISNMNRPVMTTCTGGAGMMNCVSR